ncbi:MAG TPA: hypothetical protein VJY63_07510 [Marinospirillum sp.]|uniref:hypothetical protein n=1 Tax=Marinospirillum sp. TaxID=2183934 RepID=UPI002B48B5CB|nr:hypothetical protein [Marinospirillum sp.]HKM15751.1 hypothetical protein [Marinospirillum sp.]
MVTLLIITHQVKRCLLGGVSSGVFQARSDKNQSIGIITFTDRTDKPDLIGGL